MMETVVVVVVVEEVMFVLVGLIEILIRDPIQHSLESMPVKHNRFDHIDRFDQYSDRKEFFEKLLLNDGILFEIKLSTLFEHSKNYRFFKWEKKIALSNLMVPKIGDHFFFDGINFGYKNNQSKTHLNLDEIQQQSEYF